MIRTALSRSAPRQFFQVRRHLGTTLRLNSDHGTLPTSESPITPEMKFFNSVTGGEGLIPTYRVLDGVGKPIDGATLPDVCTFLCCMCIALTIAQVDELYARKLYEHMQLLPTLDNVLYNVQRQGKISFYVGPSYKI